MDHSEINSNLIISKVMFLLGIILITLIFGVFPYYSKMCSNSSKFIGFANAFSGGIFIGIALFHLLPEASEKFESYFKITNPDSRFSKYPNQYFLMFLSYSLILFIEKIAFNSHSHNNDHGHNHDTESKHEMVNSNSDHSEKNDQIVHTHVDSQIDEDEVEEEIKKVISTRGRFSSFLEQRNIQFRISAVGRNSIFNNLKIQGRKSEAEKLQPIIEKPQVVEKTNTESSLTPFILLFSLSFHGLFEGIGLGLQKSVQNTFYLFIAIIAHKWAESFTLGITFKKAKTEKWLFYKLIVFFSLVTPLGVLIGMMLSESSLLIEAIFLSLSTGTFVYVSASEIIVEEFSITRYKYSKFLIYLLGGIFIAALAILENEADIDG